VGSPSDGTESSSCCERMIAAVRVRTGARRTAVLSLAVRSASSASRQHAKRRPAASVPLRRFARQEGAPLALARRSGGFADAHRGAGAQQRLVLRAALCSNPSSSTAVAKGDGGGKAPATAPKRWTPAWAWQVAKETALHYWHGSKLLAADVRVASRLLGRLAAGRSLSRREHNLLVRVTADIARLVPLSFFILVPMMEFALPIALRLFPNLVRTARETTRPPAARSRCAHCLRCRLYALLTCLIFCACANCRQLPSTFEEKHHAEEKRMKLLKVRPPNSPLLLSAPLRSSPLLSSRPVSSPLVSQ
jgi:hypothetical protein